jgi:hypothetical protein
VNAYVTDAELRRWLSISDQQDTDIIEVVAEAASRSVDFYTGRFFYLTSLETRTYYPVATTRTITDDIATTSGLVVAVDTVNDGAADETWDAADYLLEPVNSDGPYTEIVAVGTKRFSGVTRRRPSVHVTAQFGWAEVPHMVSQATLMLAARIYRRRNTPEGFASGESFGAIRVEREMDKDVASMLAPYRAGGGSGLVVA